MLFLVPFATLMLPISWIGLMAEFAEDGPLWRFQLWTQQSLEWLEGLLAGDGTDESRGGPEWGPWPEWISWVVLAIGLLILYMLVIQLLLMLIPYLRRLWPQARAGVTRSNRHAEPRSVATWLRLAQAAQHRGQYGEACHCLYMALLQELHDRELIAHQPSRTDGEYRQLLKSNQQQPSYEVLIGTHERFCFSTDPINQTSWEQCQQAFQTIKTHPPEDASTGS